MAPRLVSYPPLSPNPAMVVPALLLDRQSTPTTSAPLARVEDAQELDQATFRAASSASDPPLFLKLVEPVTAQVQTESVSATPKLTIHRQVVMPAFSAKEATPSPFQEPA